MYHCPKCGQTEGFIETLTHCTVVRRVDAELSHVETLDWEATGETVRMYHCVNCGARWLEWELDNDEE